MAYVAGLDIHKNNIVVCLRHTRSDGSLQEDVSTFATMTDDLLALADWLSEHQVTYVAMESTGALWKPIWDILESYNFQLQFNARELGGDYFDVLDPIRLRRHLVKRLESLGYEVTRAERKAAQARNAKNVDL